MSASPALHLASHRPAPSFLSWLGERPDSSCPLGDLRRQLVDQHRDYADWFSLRRHVERSGLSVRHAASLWDAFSQTCRHTEAAA